ncbi:hypothetical protein [Salisaeta icosahedral phage 1]|uniref:hypothetical protein n=1 Tax=Salisaeta icosahedral phage 1 TaxID=1183239 RepID=UPI00025EA943|nr:hypothetical protein A322_gp54 [Salisaeta icosahedral phage 1]AFJ21509.1 hypothetical protein [Salisaeta icosahedral phage 1]
MANWKPENIVAQVITAQDRGLIPYYKKAGAKYGFETALLLAKDSRESCLGLCLDPDGKGDNGYGWGISQIDSRAWPVFTRTTSPLNHEAIIMKGAEILRQYTNAFGGHAGGQIPLGLAAYNAGPQNVHAAILEGKDIDAYTTGGNYSTDVLKRYRVIKEAFPQYADGGAPYVAGFGGWWALVAGFGLVGAAYYMNKQ